jgi:hypothetical protein
MVTIKRSEPNTIVPSPSGLPREAQAVVDDAGSSILALLQKAADMAMTDVSAAENLVHKLSSQLLATEDRVSQLEAEAAQYRDRANRAEAWMLRIQSELEQAFVQNKECRHI